MLHSPRQPGMLQRLQQLPLDGRQLAYIQDVFIPALHPLLQATVQDQPEDIVQYMIDWLRAKLRERPTEVARLERELAESRRQCEELSRRHDEALREIERLRLLLHPRAAADDDLRQTRTGGPRQSTVSVASWVGAGFVPKVGDRVVYGGASRLPGTCRFVGATKFAEGIWVGLELESPVGMNNGSIDGVQYFVCKERHGLFLRPSSLARADEASVARTDEAPARTGRGFPAYEAAAAAADAVEELRAKFLAEPDTCKVMYGNLTHYYGGLEELVGSAEAKMQEAMEREHLEWDDAQTPFVSPTYGITTTSAAEWYFAFSPERGPEQAGLTAWPAETVFPAGREENCRRPVPWTAFTDLAPAKEAGLTDVEILALRLYSGPMFVKYQWVLRGQSKSETWECKWAEECSYNRYTSTIHAISSAHRKLGKLMKAGTVYRGLSRIVPEDDFWLPNPKFGFRGAVDWAFMSTTWNRELAFEYARPVGMVWEIRQGMVDRGADLSWISQYPHEQEVSFMPLTCLEILSAYVERDMIFVEIRLNVNLIDPTVEQVRSFNQRMVKQMSEELRRQVDTALESAASWDSLRRFCGDEWTRVYERLLTMADSAFEEVTKAGADLNETDNLVKAVATVAAVPKEFRSPTESMMKRLVKQAQDEGELTAFSPDLVHGLEEVLDVPEPRSSKNIIRSALRLFETPGQPGVTLDTWLLKVYLMLDIFVHAADKEMMALKEDVLSYKGLDAAGIDRAVAKILMPARPPRHCCEHLRLMKAMVGGTSTPYLMQDGPWLETEAAGRKCPQGHSLERFQPYSRYKCSACRQDQLPGELMHGCHDCDHYVCLECTKVAILMEKAHKFATLDVKHLKKNALEILLKNVGPPFKRDAAAAACMPDLSLLAAVANIKGLPLPPYLDAVGLKDADKVARLVSTAYFMCTDPEMGPQALISRASNVLEEIEMDASGMFEDSDDEAQAEADAESARNTWLQHLELMFDAIEMRRKACKPELKQLVDTLRDLQTEDPTGVKVREYVQKVRRYQDLDAKDIIQSAAALLRQGNYTREQWSQEVHLMLESAQRGPQRPEEVRALARRIQEYRGLTRQELVKSAIEELQSASSKSSFADRLRVMLACAPAVEVPWFLEPGNLFDGNEERVDALRLKIQAYKGMTEEAVGKRIQELLSLSSSSFSHRRPPHGAGLGADGQALPALGRCASYPSAFPSALVSHSGPFPTATSRHPPRAAELMLFVAAVAHAGSVKAREELFRAIAARAVHLLEAAGRVHDMGPCAELLQLAAAAAEAIKAEVPPFMVDANLSDATKAQAYLLLTHEEIKERAVRMLKNVRAGTLHATVRDFALLLASRPSLEELYFEGEPRVKGDVAACVVAKALETNRTIKWLGLGSCDVGPSGARALTTMLEKNTTVQELWLNHNRRLGAKFIQDVVHALRDVNPRGAFRSLQVYDCGYSREQIAELRTLQRCRTLEIFS